MATATKHGPAPTRSDGGAVVAPESAAMKFHIVEDNGGEYHWMLLDRDGNSLGRSPDLASYQDAANAARAVLAGAGSARLDLRATTDTERLTLIGAFKG